LVAYISIDHNFMKSTTILLSTFSHKFSRTKYL